METQPSAFEDSIIEDDKGHLCRSVAPQVDNIVQQTCLNGHLRAEGSDSQKFDHSEEAADTVGSFIGRI